MILNENRNERRDKDRKIVYPNNTRTAINFDQRDEVSKFVGTASGSHKHWNPTEPTVAADK